MSFTPEDGTGLPDSNSLCDVAFADSYFSLRGNADWEAMTTEEKQSALVLATDYICVRWDSRLRSEPLHPDTQALCFPRLEWDGVPSNVKRATAEYAVRSHTLGSLWPDPEVDERGMIVVESTDKLGPIEERRKYSGGANGLNFVPYPIPDMLMKPYLKAAEQARVIRA